MGAESRSGLTGLVVVKVMWLGCQPLVYGGGIGSVVRVFFRMGALFRV